MQNEEYNPFLADAYSLGLVALKMINRSWGKTELKKGLLSLKDKFEGYQPILELLNGMLEEDPRNRWDFKRAMQFYHDTKIVSKIPNDEAHYCHKWQVELKEKNEGNSLQSLEKLYEEHQKLYKSYDKNDKTK